MRRVQTSSSKRALFEPFKPKNGNKSSELFDKFRQKLDIPSNYRLVYVVKNELLNTISFGIVFVSCIGGMLCFSALLLCELTGRSKFGEVVEGFTPLVCFIVSWFISVFLLTTFVKHTTVLRIYHNPENKKSIYMGVRRAFTFYIEDFTANDVIYRFDPALKASKSAGKRFLDAATKKYGNFFIKGQLKMIDTSNFKMDKELMSVIGEKNFNLVKKIKN